MALASSPQHFDRGSSGHVEADACCAVAALITQSRFAVREVEGLFAEHDGHVALALAEPTRTGLERNRRVVIAQLAMGDRAVGMNPGGRFSDGEAKAQQQKPAGEFQGLVHRHEKSPDGAGRCAGVRRNSSGHFLAPVHEFRTIAAFGDSGVLRVLLAAVGQCHGGSSKQAQVPVPWPESNCASPGTR